MVKELFDKKEKKVEYIELIYDLIFVYMIGRNNSILHNITNGFVDGWTFVNYILCTLAVIQMWTMTTYYINVFGRHSVRDHVMMFINMFLLYFVGEGTRADWQGYHTQYHIAWALILTNIAVQYVIEYYNYKDDPVQKRRVVRMSSVVLVEAAMVAGAIFEFNAFKTSYMSIAAVSISILLTAFLSRENGSGAVDFNHLSERAMLYVVFVFGEMIIAIAGYFEGELTFNRLYFSGMAFLIVVGLFLTYGVLFDRIINREMKTNGAVYMVIHIFIVFALSNITAALEFMRNDEVSLTPKVLFLSLSMILYFACLLLLGRYAKTKCKFRAKNVGLTALCAAVFAALMFALKGQMTVNIALSVVFVFGMFFIMRKIAGQGVLNFAKNVDTKTKE